jgi:hypothetical protein
MGFIWDYSDNNFKTNFELLLDFREEHGHCMVPWDVKNKMGLKGLHQWVKTTRTRYAKKKMGDDSRGSGKLAPITDEQV